MKLSTLISEAKNNVALISEATKECPQGRYTAFYLGENGFTVGHIQQGFNTAERCLSFGSKPMSESRVLDSIQQEESMLA